MGIKRKREGVGWVERDDRDRVGRGVRVEGVGGVGGWEGWEDKRKGRTLQKRLLVTPIRNKR